MTNYLNIISRIGILKTIWINFYCLPFKQAVKFPIVLSRDVKIISSHRGCIELSEGGRFRVGFHDYEHSYPKKSSLNIKGKLILNGSGSHSFAPGTSLNIYKNAVVELGDNFRTSHNTRITIHKSLKVGEDNMWSFDIVVMDTDAHKIFDLEGNLQNYNKEITIGNHVWIGCRSVLLKGTTIPDGSVIGAGSFVTKELVKPNSIYIGNKTVKENIYWNRELNL